MFVRPAGDQPQQPAASSPAHLTNMYNILGMVEDVCEDCCTVDQPQQPPAASPAHLINKIN